MQRKAPEFSIILAAGKGTRMRSANLHKVCFPIDGKPVINRSLKMYKEAGIKHNIIVIGNLAGQVIDTVGTENDDVIFAHQNTQKGTAHAAEQGAKILQAVKNDDHEVIILAGDRILEPIVLDKLFNAFYSENCDMAFLTGPKRNNGSSRILFDKNNEVVANVEVADINQRIIYSKLNEWINENKSFSNKDINNLILTKFTVKKAAAAFTDLWTALISSKKDITPKKLQTYIPQDLTNFLFNDSQGNEMIISPKEADNAPSTNCSVYLVKVKLLLEMLDKINTENAQQEKYLSDLITLLAQEKENGKKKYKVKALQIDNPHHLMGFNDPAELLEVEEHVRQQKKERLERVVLKGNEHRKLSAWKSDFEEILSPKNKKENKLLKELFSLYSNDIELIKERSAVYLDLISLAEEKLNKDEHAMLVRSPGRVNMMGRHVDHQGGHCNLMTVGYETIVAAVPRKDDKIRLFNVNSKNFPDREFSIGELLAQLPWDDWLSLVNSKEASQLVLKYGGDWSQYVKAAVLRLQKRFSDHRLHGLDIFVSGNIPPASGLSSSSSLVVATAEALIASNNLQIYPSQLIDLCGEGEWFVGTRGGSADHAAIKLGKKDKVVKVKFHPFSVVESVHFPKDYVLAVCNSGIRAQKTDNAKDLFNHRVACYHIGLKLLHKYYPQYKSTIEYVRDLEKEKLGISLSKLYIMLLRLPEKASIKELKEMLPNENLDLYLNTHKAPADGIYPIRDVILYGMAECARSKYFANALKTENVVEVGQLMNASHDGDRVVKFNEKGESKLFNNTASNEYILDLIDDLESGEPERVTKAQLRWQPGAYRCSLPEIDLMVDSALKIDGVLGAQLAGAGLGGCMMVLAHKDAFQELAKTLEEKYYKPKKKPISIMSCKPIEGSKVLMKTSEDI